MTEERTRQILVEALDKQIAKKPVPHKVQMGEEVRILGGRWTKGTTVYRCECGCLIRNGMKYCYECGQKIDWEGNDGRK